jgi:hypothetical protein
MVPLSDLAVIGTLDRVMRTTASDRSQSNPELEKSGGALQGTAIILAASAPHA